MPWSPKDLDAVQEKWSDVRVPVRENLEPHKAEELMLTYLAIREDWAHQLVQATLAEKTADFKYDTAYHIAYLKAEGKTDKARDIDAKTQPTVQAARVAKAEAEASVLRAKLSLESAVLAHHATAKIYAKEAEGAWAARR